MFNKVHYKKIDEHSYVLFSQVEPHLKLSKQAC